MSHSPNALRDKEVLAKYQNGWQTTSRLLREGKSFSGHEPNCAYLNCNGTSFANISSVTGLDFPDDGRAICVTDWDQDGDLDLWFHNRTGPRLRLMQNRLRNTNGLNSRNYVAFRLRGTESNRDAIGARVSVQVVGDERPLIRTLHAGDGFLSQSSKELHFGLGEATRIEGVSVRWPNGKTQAFESISVNQRYSLVEGESEVTQIKKQERSLVLSESTQPVLRHPRGRTMLSNRLPLPGLPYKTLDGKDATIEPPGPESSAKLVVFVASWCPSCREELSRLKRFADSIQRVGVDVLVIALDGLDVEQASGPKEVRQLADELELPVPVGVAQPDLLKKLHLVQTVLFNRTPSLAVPLNWLVDGDGSLAAIYRGPVEIQTVLSDAAQLDRSPNEMRSAAVPFVGTWTTPPRQMLMRAVGHLFAENGFDEDHLRYTQLDTEILERQRKLASSPVQRKQLDAVYVAENYNVGVALLERSKPQQAAEYFERAVAVDPQHVNAMVNLAVHRINQRKSSEAMALLERAIDVEPDSVAARLNLGNVLSGTGQFEDAAQHYSHIVNTGKADATVHSRLARALLETGKVNEGADQLEEAVQKGANDAATLVSLAWIKATSPNDELRDGDRAAELGARILANRLGSPVMAFDVVAAAHAEQGEFDKAVASAKKAIALMGRQQNELRQQIAKRLAGYQEKRPHRDVDGKYP